MKKFLSFMLALTLLLCSAPAVLAASNGNPAPYNLSGPILRAPTPPSSSSTTSLPYSASIVNLLKGGYTYTRYCFSPTSTTISVSGSVSANTTASAKNYRISVELYDVSDKSFVDEGHSTRFTKDGTLDVTFSDLSKSSKYYLIIRNTSVSPVPDGSSISGTLTIS